ncbi:hypothetical protein DFJ58DRAFT_727073 [Suillus subalutaceus]|uniref:uncharacterized protein n=1 Tax=Suillus subalutaceus TaxID=48586 RepID=UPI001B872F53|nr:uncharacterized protein DFJ58DRAFT_727073 [Suillus subalutaceus]KAG1856625.1 hypothetical protein DFJ58DRAFT_727073 [Suillus subalutaceus]
MSTVITPEEIQAFDLDLLTAPTIKYISIAALTLFTWDLVLTFPHEVRLWNTRWTFTKFLFFTNRYFAFGTAILMTFLTFDVTPTDAMCVVSSFSVANAHSEQISGSVNAFFAVIALLLPQVILQHRVFALYGYDKKIVVPVSVLFITIFSFMMMMAVIVYLYEKDHEAQIFGACCLLGSVDWLYLFWVPMMGLDFVLVVLAGYKSLQHYFRVPDKTWSGARLMRTFARDSVLYFICNFLIYLFSTLLGKFGSSVYYQLGAITITVVPPVSANHLLINLYNSAHDEQPTWTMASEVKTSLQLARDTSRSVFRTSDEVI